MVQSAELLLDCFVCIELQQDARRANPLRMHTLAQAFAIATLFCIQVSCYTLLHEHSCRNSSETTRKALEGALRAGWQAERDARVTHPQQTRNKAEAHNTPINV